VSDIRESTPTVDDVHASAGELLARAAADFASAQARREQLSQEDRVHGHESGAEN
jgi:hypothetical protein